MLRKEVGIIEGPSSRLLLRTPENDNGPDSCL